MCGKSQQKFQSSHQMGDISNGMLYWKWSYENGINNDKLVLCCHILILLLWKLFLSEKNVPHEWHSKDIRGSIFWKFSM